MKRLVVIVGPNAVGKTTTAKCLVDKLPKTAYVDSTNMNTNEVAERIIELIL